MAGPALIPPRPLARLALAGLAASLLLAGAASAHEKWFYDAARHPTRWESVFRLPPAAGVGAAVALTAVAWLAWRARRGRDLIPGPEALGASTAGRARFYALVPVILGIHVGLPLVVLGIRGELFAPNLALAGPLRYWLGVAEIGVGLCFLYGALARLAGAALGALWLVGLGVAGIEPMLENLHYAGFAAFFVLAGRGPYAIDRLLLPALEPTRPLARRAVPVLRVATGLALSVVAFTEKLANPDLATAFLRTYPLNFTTWLGVPMPDDVFIACAGAVELLIGLTVALGLFPRVVIATAWLFVNMTLTVFNWVELLGHLPLYGVMAVLLVWTPRDEDERLWARGLLGGERDRSPIPAPRSP